MTDPAFTGEGFSVLRTVLGPLDTNVLLVVDDATGRSLIVDAADDASSILDFTAGTDVVGVVATHGHWDHVQAVPEVVAALDAPFLLHPEDGFLVDTPFTALEPGTIEVGATTIRVAHTPGHTPGSICLLLEGVALTGDTLFPGGPGATRFPYSSFDTIIASITSTLFVLPDETVAIPGHGEATTMGTERPSLPEWIDRRW